jgi:hypothetical protein
MKNNDKSAKVFKVIAIIWIVFASLYVIYGEYQRLAQTVAGVSYNRGVTNAVVQVMQEAAKCQPVPLSAGGQQMSIISLECLQQQGEDGQSSVSETTRENQ